MTLGTIIAIVLGIAVLVFLIFGFSSGWNNLWDRVTAFGGGSNNVDTIVQACALKCSSGDEYGFCKANQTLKTEGNNPLILSCDALSDKDYGIDDCGSITCKKA